MAVDMVYKGKFVFGTEVVQGTLVINDGKIVEVHSPSYKVESDILLDYSMQPEIVALPGIIDMHVHFRGFNLSYREDEYTGTRGAAKGGVTTIVEMPNTNPKMDNIKTVLRKIKEYEEKSFVDYAVYAAVPNSSEKLKGLLENYSHILGFKIFPSDYSNPYLKSVLKEAHEKDLLVVLHAEDPELIKEVNSPGERWKTRTIEAAINAIRNIYELASPDFPRIHLAHASSLEEAIEAKRLGYTVETIPHYFLLTSEIEREMGAFAKVNPPLRPYSIAKALLEAVSKGIVDNIASDHAPYSIEEKSAPFIEAPSGVPGVEITLPIMLTMANWGLLTIPQVAKLTSTNPASILKLERIGRIAPHYFANVTIVNIKTEGIITAEEFECKSKYSPFDGFKYKGKPILTILHGDVIYDGEHFIKPSYTLNVAELRRRSDDRGHN